MSPKEEYYLKTVKTYNDAVDEERRALAAYKDAEDRRRRCANEKNNAYIEWRQHLAKQQ